MVEKQAHRLLVIAEVVACHRQKDIEFRCVRKKGCAALQDPRSVSEPSHAAISASQIDKRETQFISLQTARDRVLIKPDRFILDALGAKSACQLVINPRVIRIIVVKIEKDCQGLGVLRGIAQLDGALDGVVHALLGILDDNFREYRTTILRLLGDLGRAFARDVLVNRRNRAIRIRHHRRLAAIGCFADPDVEGQ